MDAIIRNARGEARERRIVARWIVALLLLGMGATASRALADVPDAELLIREMKAAADAHGSYTMTWASRELVAGRLKPAEVLQIKESEGRFYIRTIEGQRKGSEAIFIPNWNGGRVRAHKGRFPDITVNLDPHGAVLLGDNHHPIEHAGIRYLVNAIATNVSRSRTDPAASLRYLGEDKIRGHAVWRLDLVTPWRTVVNAVRPGEDVWSFARRVQSDPTFILHANDLKDRSAAKSGKSLHVPVYYGTHVEVAIDQTTHLPLLTRIYDQRQTLYEEFEILDFDTSTPVGDADFDPANPAYGF